jgi:hypothetical protein
MSSHKGHLAHHDKKHHKKEHHESAKMAHHSLESSAIAGSSSMYHEKGKETLAKMHLSHEASRPVIYKGVFTRGPSHLVNDVAAHKLPKPIMEGLLNVGLVNQTQRQYVDGLITHPSAEHGNIDSSREPIKAEGQYVGAPEMPKGHTVAPYNPRTKTVVGHRMPVGQN